MGVLTDSDAYEEDAEVLTDDDAYGEDETDEETPYDGEDL